MAYCIGIDIGGMSVKAALVDLESYSLHCKRSIPTLIGQKSPTEILHLIAQMIKEIVRDSGVNESEIKGIGIGAPGTSDPQTGVLRAAHNLKFYGVPVASVIEQQLGKPAFLENDANLAALAECRSGNYREANPFVLVTLGTGVGGGIVINGKVFSGFNGAASELGHMVVDRRGELCTCGRTGCFETVAAASALLRIAREEMTFAGNISGEIIFEAYHQGQPSAVAVVNKYLDGLALGLANIINFLMPEVILLGGGISGQGEWFVQKVSELTLAQSFLPEGTPIPHIAVATLGNDAGILGAGIYAADRLAEL